MLLLCVGLVLVLNIGSVGLMNCRVLLVLVLLMIVVLALMLITG